MHYPQPMPQLGRFGPVLLIGLLLLILLPLLTHRSSGTGLSNSEKAKRTQHALTLVDRGEQNYLAAHGRYTNRLADLVKGSRGLGTDLAAGLTVQLDVSTDGKTYLARIVGDVLSLVRSRTGTTLGLQGCLVLKSGTGVTCPKT